MSCFVLVCRSLFFFFFQAEDGIRDDLVTGVQTCALPIWRLLPRQRKSRALGPAFHGGCLRGSMAQWPEAPEAPRPVSERTCCAGKMARSLAAWALLSSTENSHTPTKPMVMENSAGEA